MFQSRSDVVAKATLLNTSFILMKHEYEAAECYYCLIWLMTPRDVHWWDNGALYAGTRGHTSRMCSVCDVAVSRAPGSGPREARDTTHHPQPDLSMALHQPARQANRQVRRLQEAQGRGEDSRRTAGEDTDECTPSSLGLEQDLLH